MPHPGVRLPALALVLSLAAAAPAPAQFIAGRVGPVTFSVGRSFGLPYGTAFGGYASPYAGYGGYVSPYSGYGGYAAPYAGYGGSAPGASGYSREEVYNPYLGGIRSYSYSPYGVRTYTYDAFPPDLQTNNPFLRRPVSATPTPAYQPAPAVEQPQARPTQPDPVEQTAPPPARGDAPATLTVLMPTEDAELFFDSTRTTRRGTSRQFQTPALKTGTDYAYTLTARWQEGGKPRTATRRVDLRAGDRLTVDFRDTDPAE